MANSEFVAFRAEPEDVRQIRQIAQALGSGTMSSALRWAVRNAPRPVAQQPASEQEAREVQHV